MVMKSFGKSKTRNMEKSPGVNARPSQTESGAGIGRGAERRGTPRKNQMKIGTPPNK